MAKNLATSKVTEMLEEYKGGPKISNFKNKKEHTLSSKNNSTGGELTRKNVQLADEHGRLSDRSQSRKNDKDSLESDQDVENIPQ